MGNKVAKRRYHQRRLLGGATACGIKVIALIINIMRSSKIFSKSIKSIVDHRDEYNKKPHSFKAKAYEGSNQKESGAEEGLPLIRKAIKKVLVVNGGA